MLPIIRNEVVDKKKWISDEEISDYFTLAQSLPGVIAINTATAIGKKVYGLKGSIAATLGMITFPAIIIIIVAIFFAKLHEYILVQKIFAAIQALTIAMILISIISLFKTGIKDRFQFLIFILSLILAFKISPQYVIIFATLLSLIYGWRKK